MISFGSKVLFAEESEKRYETIKNEYSSLSNKYNKILDRFSSVVNENDTLFFEIEHLRQFILNNENGENDKLRNNHRGKIGSITKDKIVKKNRTISNDATNLNVNKVKNVCLLGYFW